MKCTSCKTGKLNPNFLEALLRVHTCDNCQGNWILVEDYIRWKELHPQYTFTDCVVTADDETTKALLCPMTGSIMRKLHISKDSSHYIDYSVAVAGVWLDKGEWELLKHAGLAGSLNSILTEQWQQKIRDEHAKDLFDEIYLSRFGADDYEKLKTFRLWLHAHPRKSDMFSYLLAEDPYSARR